MENPECVQQDDDRTAAWKAADRNGGAERQPDRACDHHRAYSDLQTQYDDGDQLSVAAQHELQRLICRAGESVHGRKHFNRGCVLSVGGCISGFCLAMIAAKPRRRNMHRNAYLPLQAAVP